MTCKKVFEILLTFLSILGIVAAAVAKMAQSAVPGEHVSDGGCSNGVHKGRLLTAYRLRCGSAC